MKSLWKSSTKTTCKYKNKKTVYDGITFDSKKEAQRYSELKLLEKVGKIKNLKRQESYQHSLILLWKEQKLLLI